MTNGLESHQQDILDELQSNLGYFPDSRTTLENSLGDKLDVDAIRALFEKEKGTTKKAKKLIEKFNSAFVKKKKSSGAGKASTRKPAAAAPKIQQHQLSIIIQRMMDHERNK